MSSTTPAAPSLACSPTSAGPAQPRSYSTRELQAAAAALAAGRFSRVQTPNSPVTMPAAPPGAAGPADARNREPEVAGALAIPGALVRVRAANAGAGASTITLALADAADGVGIRTRVLDAAAPAWSGLIGAAVTELGASDGWRRGRRGAGVLIERVEDHVQRPGSVPLPREVDGIDLTVLDTGWTTRELDASTADASTQVGGGCWVASRPAHVEVMVTRPHALALGQAEAMLAHLENTRLKKTGLSETGLNETGLNETGLKETGVVVVVVGAERWAGREFAGAGPRLRRLHEGQGLVFVPKLSAKALPGLGPEPLPRQLMGPARRLLDRITTITGPLSADRTD